MRICEIPEGLAVMPPGADLSAALSVVEPSRVPNDRMLELAGAQYRQLCHEQARMAGVLAELGRCVGFSEPGEVRRRESPDRFASEEIRAALCWTRRAAENEHDLAEAVVSRWPVVFAAWLAGDIDRSRVRVFERYLTGLGEAQAEGVCRIAVPKASRLTTGQLGVLLRRMVIAVDPDAAARWYRKAVAERTVVAYAAADGTITVSANGLPADEAEAACIRLQDLASKAKRAGHPGLIGQIRCDLFLGLLDGRFHHLTAEQVIAALIADYHVAAAEEHLDAAEATDDVQPDDVQSGGDRSESERSESDRSESDRSGGVQSGGAQPPSTHPSAGDSPADAGAAGDSPADAGAAYARPAPGSGADQRVGIELRVGLATLLGRDEHPAEIPGLGLLLAPDARRRVLMQARAEWRFALTDDEGRLVFDGLTRRRPFGIRRDGVPGGIVELHLSVELLAELQAGDPRAGGDWARVIDDIAGQYAHRDDPRRDLDARPGARLPGAALRRHTEIRDRTCTFMGCRRRAQAAQQDHTVDYHRGGGTVRNNLGPLCPHDHQVKHLGGWRVEQRDPGVFLWHSPLGGVYRTSGETFLPPMPDPTPRIVVPDRCEVVAEELIGPILGRFVLVGPPDRPTRRPQPHGDPYDPPPF